MTVSGGHAIAAPLPGRLRAYGPTYFVDREDQQRVLHEALSDVTRVRERRAAFILGEPGIGKTRLVSEIGLHAHQAGLLVLAGRCDEGLDLAYQPFVEAIEHLIEFAPAELLEEHVAVYGDSIARLVPTLRRRVSALAPAPPPSEGERYLLYAAIEGLLAAAAGDQALLLVLEDLHWADVPTLLVLRRLLTSPRTAPILILGTARAGDIADEHPLRQLLADLHREPGVVRFELGGLGSEDIVALLRGIAENPLEAAEQRLGETLKRTTDGNPFYITELVRNLAEAGQLVRVEGRWGPAPHADGELELPASISETLARRIARLGPVASLCLTTAAVIGFEFDSELVSTVAETDSVAAMLDRAVASGLLVGVRGVPGQFRFAHVLVQRHLYCEVGAAMRAELHQRIATALERRLAGGGVRVADLARHWLAASRPPELEKPIGYAVLAGDEAMSSLAPDEAVRWYEIALDLSTQLPALDETRRCELLIKRGEAERQAGRPEFRETLLEAARLAQAIGDDRALIRAALANTRGMQSETGIVDGDRIEQLLAARDRTEPGDTYERAQLLARHAAELMYSGRWELQLSLSDEALAIARRLDDPDLLSEVLNMRFVTLLTPQTHAERAANTVEALRAAEGSADPLTRFYAHHWRAGVCIEAGDVVAAERCVAAEREVSERIRHPTTLWLTRADEANMALMRGTFDDAERLAAETFELGRASEPDALACFTAQQVCIAFERGTLGNFAGTIEAVVEQNPGIPGFRSTLALALCEQGQTEEAARILAGEAESRFAHLAHDVTWLTVACVFAHVCARLEDAVAGRRLYGLLEPFAELIAYPYFGIWGPVEHYLGGLALTLGDLDHAGRHLRSAAEINERLRAPAWAVRNDLLRIRLAERAGEPGSGPDPDAVRAAAERLGCAGALRQLSGVGA